MADDRKSTSRYGDLRQRFILAYAELKDHEGRRGARVVEVKSLFELEDRLSVSCSSSGQSCEWMDHEGPKVHGNEHKSVDESRRSGTSVCKSGIDFL